MRFFRLTAITVLLLACVVLGSACAGAKGEEGPQGAKGDTGATGVGVQNIVNNADGTFTVNLSNGTAYTTDNLTGPKGEKGDTGAQGVQGIQGLQGTPGIGVEWVGEWDSSVLYAKYDGVGYQGSSYISRQNNNTNHLPTDTNWWDLWVEKGDIGEQGIQGIQGVQGIPGFSTVVAMGNWDVNNYLLAGYNVVSVSHPETGKYIVTLNGIDFDWAHYVAIVNTPSFCGGWGGPSVDVDGALNIWVRQANSTAIDSYFQFVVFEIPD